MTVQKTDNSIPNEDLILNIENYINQITDLFNLLNNNESRIDLDLIYQKQDISSQIFILQDSINTFSDNLSLITQNMGTQPPRTANNVYVPRDPNIVKTDMTFRPNTITNEYSQPTNQFVDTSQMRSFFPTANLPGPPDGKSYIPNSGAPPPPVRGTTMLPNSGAPAPPVRGTPMLPFQWRPSTSVRGTPMLPNSGAPAPPVRGTYASK